MEHVNELAEKDQYEAARDLLLQIAANNPGTSLGAEALTGAADLTGSWLQDKARARLLKEQILVDYVGTRYDLHARLSLIDTSVVYRDLDLRMEGYSEVALRFGAPSVEAVIGEGNRSVVVDQTLALHPEIRLALQSLYYNMYAALRRDGRRDEATRINLFGRMALDSASVPRNPNPFFADLRRDIASERGVPTGQIGVLPSTPALTVLSPLPGQTVGSQPTLSVLATTGDYRFTPVNVSQVQLTLDGVDRSYEVGVDSEINNTLTEGVNFETLTLSLKPTLTPGSHTASMTVVASSSINNPPEGPAKTTVTWSFTVSENPPPDPTTETLPATKDALIDSFDPNGNEGANKILALDKLLGRSSRSLVGFDLSEVDTANLTRATLVLSIHKEERIFGCGPGESVSVYPLTTPWVEGNGRAYKVLPFSHRFRGSGAGSTWQRDIDTNIANLAANGGMAWTGASSKVRSATAAPLLARDDMEGTLEFDVTDDVLDGAQNGWLIRKNYENRASRISFYSKEGAAAKGDLDLAPRLILEYGGQTATSGPQKFTAAVAKFSKLQSQPVSLQASAAATEGPRGVKQFLRGSARSAYVGEQVLLGFAGRHPLAQLGARVVYRSWLRETPSLV